MSPLPCSNATGAVHADVASAMAEGVRRRLDATFGVATTGVAGPDPADGQPVGTVHIAASGQLSTVRQTLSLAGGRRSIRDQTVLQSLLLLQRMLETAGT